MKIFHGPKFARSLKKLPGALIEKVIVRSLLFESDPFDPRLDTHKLHGKLKEFWSFSVDSRYRILFEFDKSDATFLDVGTHDIYK